jgi:hypothetical protein
LIHLGRARDRDLAGESDADLGILDRRLRGSSADDMDELVIVGGRWSGAFRLDYLACGILEADDSLNRAAFVLR